ncbi:serine protease [Desulfosarcina alkanivorans]|uniref:Serine protease n=1 Tax=Desulfosarcina alkanivorans TaxID=571177 RepID=A0A5K7YC35_9BACT|nr:nodulation protein NfeD [Desulfosarcina alkanivorans]BBO66153.1 serine protease [Desulfosarcina alkanivorans]
MLYRAIIVILLVAVSSLPAAGAAHAGPLPVYLVRLTGAVSPGNADFLGSAIRRANAESAGCLIVMLDTPGGLAESMRKMVMAIYDSRIPVVVYVSPSGARAASAGVMITMAADVAAMAPGTHIGAAHPVNAGGKDLGETMAEKVTNDMVAFVKSIAEKRGRNVEWAEEAVRESVSVTETEALEKKIVDLVARDLDDLIDQVQGREIADKGRVDIDPDNRVWIAESMRTRILKALSDPNIAYILMMIGLAGLYFELSHPGVILPGVIGSIALVLAFYSFQTLPVNIAGVLLIVLAIIFFILEMKIASFGLLSVAGIISLLLGSVMLFDRVDGRIGISWTVIVPTICLVGGFFAVVAGLVFRSRTRRPMTGGSGLIGEAGVVKTPLTPTGRILVHGELWLARCARPVGVGQRVRVTAVDGLTLDVEPEAPVAEP